jgi:hypothetical protein
MRNLFILVAVIVDLFVIALFTVNKQLDNKYKEATLNLKNGLEFLYLYDLCLTTREIILSP